MNDAAPNTEKVEYEAGSWQATLDKSRILFERGTKARKQAGLLLWQGAQAATEEWLDDSDTDVHGEVLQANLLDIMGAARKGDVSKIKTVALAVKNNGLVLAQYANLSKAYAEATRLTKTVKVQQAEDDAADEVIQNIAASKPKSSSTPDGAVLIVLAGGVDEAARLLVNALNGEGEQADLSASRAMLRALAQEITGRIPKPAPKAPAAKKAAKKATAKKATVKAGASKAKPAAKKATAKKAASAPAKPKPAAAPEVEDAPVEDEQPTAEDLFENFDGEVVEDEDAEVEETPEPEAPAKAKPVRRGPVRRG